jgi:hypothetical protein
VDDTAPAVGAGVASDNHMEKFSIFSKLLKYIRSKVYATIGNQELQIGR